MNGGPAPDPYFQAIEEAFNRRRGAAHLLSPRDWGLIADWQKRGIPLRIVLAGIENCFDAFHRRGPSARRINSLGYCRQEVLSLHELYLGLRAVEAGRPAEPGAPANPEERTRIVGRHLTRLARRAREAMAHASADHLDPLVGVLAAAAADLKNLRKALRTAPVDPHDLETTLAQLDAGLVAAARAALPAAEVERVAGEAAAALGAAADRMTPEARRATLAAAEARLLRQRCRLPRFTLFD